MSASIHRVPVPEPPAPLKARIDLLPATALLEAGRVVADGELEHGERWRDRAARHHVAAALRHTFRWLAGERIDPDSGHSHLAHAATRLLMALANDLDDQEQTR